MFYLTYFKYYVGLYSFFSILFNFRKKDVSKESSLIFLEVKSQLG